jgi:hypothetical protein
MRLVALSVLTLALAPAVAAAAPRPLPADQHQPPLFLDVGSAWINAVSRDSTYQAKAFFRVVGATSKNDRMRFEWKAGGKLIAAGACSARWYQAEQVLDGTCALDKDVATAGPIDVDVIYTDDQDDKEYLVATLRTEVRRWPGIGKTQYWGLVQDDLLGAAFVRSVDSSSATRVPLVQFWSTHGSLHGKASLRCTASGAKLPDFDARLTSANHGVPQSLIESSFTSSKLQRTYTFQHYELDPGFRFGPKTEEDKAYTPDQARFAADHPGAWDCMLRKDGKQLRQLMFTVDAQGRIQHSEMQRGKRPLKTPPNVVLIDMKIPADNGVEKRIRPDAMKKSLRFGVPWPEHPRAKELQAAFPPASGLPD